MRSARFGTHLLCLLFVITLIGYCPSINAVPAPKRPFQITQPDGTKLTVVKRGDEFFHYVVSSDGYTLRTDSLGFYRYTVRNSKGDLVPGPHVAADPTSRSSEATRFLSTIEPEMRFSPQQRAASIERRVSRPVEQVTSRKDAVTTPLSNLLMNHYPLSGTVKSLVILVNFSDNDFTVPQPDSAFSHLLNQKGYHEGDNIGSVSDYYTFNSGGKFTPQFVVAGPVKLKKTMAYYGGNLSENERDVHAQEMIRDACLAVSDSVGFAQLAVPDRVNFSQFDNDGDGYVDNVYVFYAGKGEADSNDPNTIWPHSYSLGSDYPLTLNGKRIDNYGCSAELDGYGQLTGIGVFAHEFGHVLGLPDFYDVDGSTNDDGFDLGEWSLMASGSYNHNGSVPPCLTLLERYMLNWADPTPLSVPASPNLSPLVSSNQGLLIPTNNRKEFFLLENRQQVRGTWDEYIPYHGMLVYHIDARSDAYTWIDDMGTTKKQSYEWLWQNNLVNAIGKHQCADIEEADNSRLAYNGHNYLAYTDGVKGDPYPGYYSITKFADNTLKTWNDTPLNKPITQIAEQVDGNVTFDFMGGKYDMDTPLAREANRVYPFSFVARWHSVKDASGYLLDVFTWNTSTGDSIKAYVSGYHNYAVSDTSCIIHVPSEQSAYFYQVRSTNGFKNSNYSEVISLSTTNSKPVIRPAADIRPFQFKANWASLPWATGYHLTVFKIDTLPGGNTTRTILPRYNNILTTDTAFLVDELDNERAYGYFMAGTDGSATGVQSEVITLTTPSATAITYFVRNGYIYLKGIDPGSTVTLYGTDGLVKQVSHEPTFNVPDKGLYIVEFQFKNARKRIKVMVN